MAHTNTVPAASTRTGVQIGTVVADERTGDLRELIYADSRIVLARDESGSTTMIPRSAFETEVGTRYRVRRDAEPDVDGGQYEQLRERLAEYDAREGRKARHKADALREALDLLADEAGANSDSPGEDSDGETDAGEDREVDFEEIPGIGPETASNLRSQGFVTVADVDAASDDVLGSISGVGPDTVANIREALE